MTKQSKVKIDLDELTGFLRELGGEYVVKVGILGNKASEIHQGTDATNAEIGLIHEFGSESKNIPIRSWLRMPIMEREKEIVNGMSKGAVRQAFEEGDVKRIYRILGILAENQIREAFASGGFGHWPSIKPATAIAKGNVGMLGTAEGILIETGQLRRAVSSQVVKRGSING